MGSRDLAGSSSAAALARLERYGVDDFTDAELLEMTIAAWSTAADAAAIAKRLLTRFGLYSDVLAAPRELLCEVEGVSHRLAARLKLVMYAAHRFADDRMANSRPPLTSVTELVAYCRTKMAFEPVEQLRAFFLNQKFTIIADEVVSRGGVNHVAIEEREVLRRAVQLRASNIVLAHNHPSGDPTRRMPTSRPREA